LKKSGIPIQANNNCVVASIQIDLNTEMLDLFRNELLTFCAKVNPDGIVLDVSGQRIMDDRDFLNLRKIVDSAKIMGYPTVMSGFKPGVVASLVALDVNIDGILATRNMDEAFLLLTKPELTIEVEDNEEESETNIENHGEDFGENSE